MKLDYDTSTVTIDGRRFPTCCLICPPDDSDDPGSDRDRMLGGPGGPGITNTMSYQAIIPCENGVLLAIEEFDDQPGYTVTLHARTCQETPWDDAHIWVPHIVAIDGGKLVAATDPNKHLLRSPWRWEGAEADWTAELVDRVNRMPFTQPPGPEMRLITLAEARELDAVQ